MESLVATLLLVAAQLGVEADARSETRVGLGPIVAGAESHVFVAQMVVPVLELNAKAQGLTIRLQYLPRIYWQDPRPVDVSGPLILHTANLILEASLSRGTTITASATGSLGQPDYGALPRLLGTTTQGALPAITTIASGSGRAAVATRLSPRVRLNLATELFRWASLDPVDPQAPATNITSMTVASVYPSAVVRLTRRNDLGVGATFGEVLYSTGTRYLNVTPLALWDLHLTAQKMLRTTAGVAFVHPLAIGAGTASTADLLSPVGSVELDGRVARWQSVSLRFNGGSGVSFFFDPVLGTASPRAFVRAGSTLTVAPDWIGGLRGEFATGPAPETALASDVTTYVVTAFARKLLSPYLFAELGGMWADRGPALSASAFAFHQPLRWVYLSLTGTTRAVGRWSE